MSDDLLIQRIEDLIDGSRLSAWETDFLESVLLQVKGGRSLTDKQHEVLERLEERE